MKKSEEKPINASVRRRAVKGRSTLEIHRLGPHPLIQHFLERLDVARILDKHIHSNRTGTLSHGSAICVLVHNVLVSRDPLYRLTEWIEQLDANALGLDPEKKEAINDDRMGRALDQLADYGGRGVFFQLALRSIKLFRLDTTRIHFDTTSVLFKGQYRSSTKTPRICHGHSNYVTNSIMWPTRHKSFCHNIVRIIFHHIISKRRTWWHTLRGRCLPCSKLFSLVQLQ